MNSKKNAETLQKGFGAATIITCGPQQGCTYSDILDIPMGTKAYVYPKATNAPNNDPGIVEVSGYSRNSFYTLTTNSKPPQKWIAVKHEIDGFSGWQQL